MAKRPKLSDDEIEEKFAEARKRMVRVEPNLAVALMDPVAHCVATVRRIVFEHLDQMPSERWSDLITELRDDIDDMKRLAKK